MPSKPTDLESKMTITRSPAGYLPSQPESAYSSPGEVMTEGGSDWSGYQEYWSSQQYNWYNQYTQAAAGQFQAASQPSQRSLRQQ